MVQSITAPTLCVARLSTMICKAPYDPATTASPVSSLGTARQAQQSIQSTNSLQLSGGSFASRSPKAHFLLPELLFQLPNVPWLSNFLQEAFHNSPGWAGAPCWAHCPDASTDSCTRAPTSPIPITSSSKDWALKQVFISNSGWGLA